MAGDGPLGWVAGNSRGDLQGSPSGLVQTALRRGGGDTPCSLSPERVMEETTDQESIVSRGRK